MEKVSVERSLLGFKLFREDVSVSFVPRHADAFAPWSLEKIKGG